MILIDPYVKIFIVSINSTAYETNDNSISSPIKTQNQSRPSLGTRQICKWEWHQNNTTLLNGGVLYNHQLYINLARLIKNQNRQILS